MALEIYMIGLIVKDMPAALSFYRRLGLEIPESNDALSHVEVKMGNMSFFLDSKPGRWDPGYGQQPGMAEGGFTNRYPTVLEFYLKEQPSLEAKYKELVDFGYEGFREPYDTTFKMRFAMVKDPDGNTILLSADLAEQAAAP
jgi:catechol 2,3-dioxygenase-like lactoylglutathione lyase family enzyme